MTESQSSRLMIILLVSGSLFVLLLIIALFLPSQSRARPAAYKNQSVNRMKNLLEGVLEYRAENNDMWPEKLDDTREFTDRRIGYENMIGNPYTHDNPGYEYIKPSPNADPSKTVVLYQLRDGKRDINLRVGFGDGRVLPYSMND